MESAPWLLPDPAPRVNAPAPVFPPGTRVASPWERARRLFRRRLHLIVEVNVILLVQRLVAVEAGAEIGAGVHALVRLEGLVLPLAVAYVVGVLGAPARALFHHRVADEVALDEPAVGVLFRIALVSPPWLAAAPGSLHLDAARGATARAAAYSKPCAAVVT